MTKPANTRAISETTGRDWPDWKFWLDAQQAYNLPHNDIVKLIQSTFTEVTGWWAQSITVAYEQDIGRRDPGQRADGDYSVSVSRTVDGNMDDALARWQDQVAGKQAFNDVAVASGPTVSMTQKWRYWRCQLADGSKVTLNVQSKGVDRSTLGIQHDRIASPDIAETWRQYWRERLGSL